jgi:hypothetical protein
MLKSLSCRSAGSKIRRTQRSSEDGTEHSHSPGLREGACGSSHGPRIVPLPGDPNHFRVVLANPEEDLAVRHLGKCSPGSTGLESGAEGWRCSSVVYCLPSMHKTLSSLPNTTKLIN